EAKRNSLFSIDSSYLPVTKEASTTEYLSKVIEENFVSEAISNGLLAAVETTQANNMYTSPAFDAGAETRAILNSTMPEAAMSARKELLNRVANGEDYSIVLAELTSDEVFHNWYNDTNEQLLQYFKK
ncbi:MAG: hypothetical protein ACRCW1_00195, partial [Anaerotignaceae bacterium]